MNILTGKRVVAVKTGKGGSVWIQVVHEDRFRGSPWDCQRWCRHDSCRSEAILAAVRDYAPRAPEKDVDRDLAIDAQFWLLRRLSLNPGTLHRWLVWWAQRWINNGGGVPAGMSAMESFWNARWLIVEGSNAN